MIIMIAKIIIILSILYIGQIPKTNKHKNLENGYIKKIAAQQNKY